jgi:hypothetical protein
MRWINSIALAIATLLIFSCTNRNAEPKASEQETTEKESETVPSPEAALLQKSFPDLFSFYSSQDSSFSPELFQKAQENVLDSNAYPINQQELKPYYPYFIYSPDSNHAIDIYSYNIIFEKRDGKTIAQATGPDIEAALIDLNNKTRKRVLFGGSTMVILDASWLDNHEFLLTGGEIIGNKLFQPHIWQINIIQNTIQNIIYEDSLTVRPVEYQDKRMKNIEQGTRNVE